MVSREPVQSTVPSLPSLRITVTYMNNYNVIYIFTWKPRTYFYKNANFVFLPIPDYTHIALCLRIIFFLPFYRFDGASHKHQNPVSKSLFKHLLRDYLLNYVYNIVNRRTRPAAKLTTFNDNWRTGEAREDVSAATASRVVVIERFFHAKTERIE